MLRQQVLSSWNGLQEQITSKFYQLQKTNYIFEKDQKELFQKIAQMVEVPVDYPDQALNCLVHLSMNCRLTDSEAVN